MEPHGLNPDALELEEAFFARENARLLKDLRAKHELEARREALRAVLGRLDDATVDHLLDAGLHAETAVALAIVPMAAVAWADGQVQPKEREAILKAAAERGVIEGSPSFTVLTSWLERKPDQHLIEAWKRYARGLWEVLEPADRVQMRQRVVERAREIAESAGGFLGLGAKISEAEQKVIGELERTLS